MVSIKTFIKPDFFTEDSLFGYYNQIGFFNQDELSIVCSNFNPDVIDNIELKSAIYTSIGRLFFLEGDFIRAKELFHCAQEIIEARPDMIKGDYRAFLYYEMCLFYRVLQDKKLSEQYANQAKQHVKSKNLLMLINYQLETFQAENNSVMIAIMQKRVNEFFKNKIYYQYVIGLSRLGFIHLANGEMETAKDYLIKTETAAKKYKIPYMLDIALNGLGYWYYENEEYQKALDALFIVVESAKSNYVKVLALENIALTYHKKYNYDNAVDYMVKAYNIASIHHVVSQIPEECMLIGKWYDEHLNKPEQALHYYKLGFDHAVKQVDNGLGFNGPRRLAIMEYVSYSQKLNFRKLKGIVVEKPFEFALGKKWVEIKPLFQYHLIMYHRNQAATSNDFLKRMGLTSNSYYSKQRQIKKKGYPVPRLKEMLSQTPSEILVQPLQLYIAEKLKNFNWKEANAKFEKDIFLYLFQQYGFTKKNLGESLGLSIIAVNAKTEEIFESSYTTN
jgi:tetratricopeptide (TPR) repeat protein